MSRWFRTYGFADVLDGFVIGAYPLDWDDVATLAGIRIERVLNLVADSEYPAGERELVAAALTATGIEERRLRLTDFGGLPPGALETAVQQVNGWLDEGRRTYLHCRAGWQRSAAVAAGVVAIRGGLEIPEALEFVHYRKPSANPLPHQREDLERWWADRRTARTGGRRSRRSGGRPGYAGPALRSATRPPEADGA